MDETKEKRFFATSYKLIERFLYERVTKENDAIWISAASTGPGVMIVICEGLHVIENGQYGPTVVLEAS